MKNLPGTREERKKKKMTTQVGRRDKSYTKIEQLFDNLSKCCKKILQKTITFYKKIRSICTKTYNFLRKIQNFAKRTQSPAKNLKRRNAKFCNITVLQCNNHLIFICAFLNNVSFIIVLKLGVFKETNK